MRAAVYVRVSTEDQARHGYSLAEQRSACEAQAREAGAGSVVVFADEGISGEVLERPGLTALRDAVRAGQIDVVYVRDADRLSRRVAHQLLLAEEFERAGVRVEFLDSNYQDTPEGRLFFTIRSSIAEYEKEKIRDRTMRGKRQKARQGLIPDVFNVYGYRLHSESGQVEIDQAEAEIVREIFNRFVSEDLGMNGIARLLNERGVPTRSGRGQWSKTVIRQMLRQHAYVGIWYYGKRDCRGVRVAVQRGEKRRPKSRGQEEWIPIPVPAIVDVATWERAQERLEVARRLWAGQARGQYLLSGIIECGECGAPMGGRKQKLFGQKVQGYSCFRNIQGVKHVGCRPFKFVRAGPLEAAVWETIRAWLDDPDALVQAVMGETSGTASLSLQDELTQIEKNLAQVGRGRENILTVLAEGRTGISDAARAKLDDLARREARLLHRKREIETAMSAVSRSRTAAAEIRRVALEVARDLDNLDFAARRALVRSLIRRIVVSGRPRKGLRVMMHAAVPGVVLQALTRSRAGSPGIDQ